MNNRALNKLIRDQMPYGMEFSFEMMEGIYNDIMNYEQFITCKKVSIKRYHNMLSDWAAVDGGWLGKKGKAARFYKVEPAPIVISYRGFVKEYKSFKEGFPWVT